jgi:predicted HicB family RNase H-like nuclease
MTASHPFAEIQTWDTTSAIIRFRSRTRLPIIGSWCKERGNEPEKPYSGTLSLRIAPELHRRVAEQAAKAGGEHQSIHR